MRLFILSALFITALHFNVSGQPLTWVKSPTLVKVSDTVWNVNFEISRATDVEVSIVNLKDSTILRHLAAGLLGSNPPAPLAANSLAQSITWNGKADYGRVHDVPQSMLGVRVRAGMKASFDNMVGNDPYTFRIAGSYANWWYHRGMVSDTEGNVYMYGSSTNSGGLTLRCFDKNGNYMRTVFPPPASLTSTEANGYGLNFLNTGGYTIQNGTTRATMRLSPTIVGGIYFTHNGDGIFAPSLVNIENNKDLCFLGDINKWMTISKDGSRAGNPTMVDFITSPALPATILPSTVKVGGNRFVCLSPDGKYYYLSGLWEFKSSTAVDTGFWRDGQIYKVSKATGAASPFIAFSGVPTTASTRSPILGGSSTNYTAYSAIHGMTCDDSGRIFVCDRFNGRIGVYDTAGTYLGGIPLKYADQVSVVPKTGEIYAITRNSTGSYTGFIKLYKFSEWRNSPSPVCSVLVSNDVDFYSSVAYLTVARGGTGTPVIWVSHLWMKDAARLYKDNGTSFTLLKGLSDGTKNFLCSFDRLSVDRKHDDVYINDASSALGKVTDWSNPAIIRCSTTAMKPLSVIDVAISHDGQLYVQDKGDLGGPVRRYDMGKYHAPINWTNTDSNIISGGWARWGALAGLGGIAIAPDKKVTTSTPNPAGGWFYGLLADSGRAPAKNINGYYIPTDIIDTLAFVRSNTYTGSPRFDMDGNFYIGVSTRSKFHVRTKGFENDKAYGNSVGSIYKFKAETYKGNAQTRGGCCSLDTLPELNSTGYEKIYLTGLAPFSSYEYCACRSPRFDVDNYKRLIVPNAITQKVTVIDNNGNEIMSFGEYGNYDSRGSGSNIPLAWPTGSVASDNFIYVTDFGNNRLIRVKMDFELENIHLPITSAMRTPSAGKLSLRTSPNPFNPACKITVDIPHLTSASLEVYSADGRIVKIITNAILQKGQYSFTWNGKNNNGEVVSAGLYIFRLTAATKCLSVKALLAK